MNTREFSLKHCIDERLIQAVIAVESSGSGFNIDGSLKIRFENHLTLAKHPFLSKWFSIGSPVWTNHKFRYPSFSNKWRDTHADYFSEYQALLICQSQIGLECFDYCSMGSFQILSGYHYKKLGFENSIGMFVYMSKSQENDLEVGLRFIASNDNLLRALQQRNFYQFALLYNGNNSDVYSERIEREYNK